MSNEKSNKPILGRGYYIALLCAAAVGLCGFLYYRSASREPAVLQDPGAPQSAIRQDVDAQAGGGDPQTRFLPEAGLLRHGLRRHALKIHLRR